MKGYCNPLICMFAWKMAVHVLNNIALFEMQCTTTTIHVFSFQEVPLVFPRVPCEFFTFSRVVFRKVPFFKGNLPFQKGNCFQAFWDNRCPKPWPKHVASYILFDVATPWQISVQTSPIINLKFNFPIDIQITPQINTPSQNSNRDFLKESREKNKKEINSKLTVENWFCSTFDVHGCSKNDQKIAPRYLNQMGCFLVPNCSWGEGMHVHNLAPFLAEHV